MLTNHGSWKKSNFWTNWSNWRNHLTSVAVLVSGFGSDLSGKGPAPNITPSKTSQTDVWWRWSLVWKFSIYGPRNIWDIVSLLSLYSRMSQAVGGCIGEVTPTILPQNWTKRTFRGTPKHLGVKAMVFRRFSLQNQSKWQPWLVATSKWLSLKTGYPAIWWLVG